MNTKNITFLILCFLFSINTSIEASERRLKLIATDEETKTRFSVIEEIGGMPGSDPCKSGGFLVGLDVIGEVPDNVSLEDDAKAKSLIEKGKNAAIKTCPRFKLGHEEIRIMLYKGGYDLGQDKKPEVFAKWKKVPSFREEIIAEAIKKGPTDYYNKAFERFEKQKLAEERTQAGSDASRIIVTSVQLLDTDSSYPRYSSDGSKILYSKQVYPKKKQPGQSFQIQVIKDVKTLKTIKAFGKAGTSRKGAWSPDSQKIAYFATARSEIGFIGVRGKLHIFDIASGETVKLDYQEPAYGGFIVWAQKQEIYVLETGRHIGFSLNLETLKESNLPGDVYQRYLKNARKDWWSDFSTHKYCYIYREDVKRGTPSLVVANTDNSYARVLITGVYDQHPYVVSPDLISVVYSQNNFGRIGDLYVAYLGQRAKPRTTFKVRLSDSALTEKINVKLSNNVTLKGSVFGPRINPLNKKLVGPDEKVFKGYIKFTSFDGSRFIATTTFEKESFDMGDIVSEIYSEDGSIGRNSFGQLNTATWGILENL